MGGKFATMESNLLKAIKDSKEAIPAPPAPSGTPGTSGSGALSNADATSRSDPRPGIATAHSQPWVNDVTTPPFYRAPDATKFFRNIHDRVQVAKPNFREKLLVLVARGRT